MALRLLLPSRCAKMLDEMSGFKRDVKGVLGQIKGRTIVLGDWTLLKVGVSFCKLMRFVGNLDGFFGLCAFYRSATVTLPDDACTPHVCAVLFN